MNVTALRALARAHRDKRPNVAEAILYSVDAVEGLLSVYTDSGTLALRCQAGAPIGDVQPTDAERLRLADGLDDVETPADCARRIVEHLRVIADVLRAAELRDAAHQRGLQRAGAALRNTTHLPVAARLVALVEGYRALLPDAPRDLDALQIADRLDPMSEAP